MSNENVTRSLAEQSDAIGLLAQDSGAFAAVFAAFGSKDPRAFRWVLERLDLLPRCELICEWVRIKSCVLRCLEVCGPIPEQEETELPNLREFALAITKLSANEKLLRRVIDAVSCGNAAEYHAAISELQLRPFCRLICQYVCSILYHRVCELFCTPQPVIYSDAASLIREDAKAIVALTKNEKAFDTISKAAISADCGIFRTAIERAGFFGNCETICHLFCIWRCVWTCREICRFPTPILSGAYAVDEARNFALASVQLAGQPRALVDLVAAVEGRDAKSYAEIISRFGLGPYCYQICGWICSRICSEFCYCVCPSNALNPLFTKVGLFDIYADIDSTSGRTNKSIASAGGADFALYSCLELRGFCPATSPADPSVAMKYRFLYDNGSGPQALTNAAVCNDTELGSRTIPWPENVAGVAGSTSVFDGSDRHDSCVPATSRSCPPRGGSALGWTCCSLCFSRSRRRLGDGGSERRRRRIPNADGLQHGSRGRRWRPHCRSSCRSSRARGKCRARRQPAERDRSRDHFPSHSGHHFPSGDDTRLYQYLEQDSH